MEVGAPSEDQLLKMGHLLETLVLGQQTINNRIDQMEKRMDDNFAKKAMIVDNCIFTDFVTIVSENGDVYTGQAQDGLKHGRGVMKYANGNQYTGEWKDDKKHGHGVMKDFDGSEYTGEWKNGSKV